MQSCLGGDKGGAAHPLKQISQREGQDRGAFRVGVPALVFAGRYHGYDEP